MSDEADWPNRASVPHSNDSPRRRSRRVAELSLLAGATRRSGCPTTPTMKFFRTFLSMALTTTLLAAAEPASAPAWTALQWKGETAYALATPAWRAVVSVERGRLVHFGPADAEANLLLTPEVRGNDTGWGGHRAWLGPQATWPVVWPPPAAWEQSGAESAKAKGAHLELTVPDAGGDWARLTRVYELTDGKLACTIRVRGGKRSAQVMQILQLPKGSEVELQARPTAEFPQGYVRLFGTKGPTLETEFKQPSVVARTGDTVKMRFTNEVEKLGFAPQAILAHVGWHTLRLSRGADRGRAVGTPDAGHYTQAYCGTSYSQFVEIEQMSPEWAAGEDAETTMVLELVK